MHLSINTINQDFTILHMWRSIEMKNSLPCPFRTAIYRGQACIHVCSVSRTNFNFRYVGDSPYTTTRKEYNMCVCVFQLSWSLSQIHSNKSKGEHAWTVCDAASFGGDEPSSENIFLHTINTSSKC